MIPSPAACHGGLITREVSRSREGLRSALVPGIVGGRLGSDRGSHLMFRVLFVCDVPSPFILQDRDILRKLGEVREFQWSAHRHPARALVREMIRHRRAFDLVYIWFGDLHATMATTVARWLRKPSILVVGGYDVSGVPGYGFLATAAGRRRARGHFRRASRILPVSRALEGQLHATFPITIGKTIVVPTGVDPATFTPGGPQEPCVLCVAPVATWPRALVKGLDRFVEVARLLPNVPFTVVGVSADVGRRLESASNLQVYGPLPQTEILPLYRRTAVYVQPSRSEGLPTSVMEAMACGCVPVVTRVGGMPDLVGDAGYVVSEDVSAIASAIREALRSSDRGVRARNRVAERFSIAQRERHLRQVIENLLGQPVGSTAPTS